MRFFSAVFLFFCFSSMAQSDPRVAPTTIPFKDIERIVMPPMDNKTLYEEEMAQRRPGTAPRFAVNIPVEISPATHGNWEILPNGYAVWRIRILSKNAKSLNLGFSEYHMPERGSLILYSPDLKNVIGPFSPADNEEHAQLWTPVLDGEELIIEVQLPKNLKAHLKLQLSYVNHDFLGFSSLLSGSCNLDVICGGADGLGIVEAYRDIIQSVAVYGVSGSIFCTGFLVNNTRQDCTPFFMTANHCGMNANNAPSLVAYWNYQNSYCRQPDSPESGGAGNGELTDFNTGAIFRASSAATDFSLLELDDPVSETANAFFAGWSNENLLPDTAICIHHPNTEEKRISFEFDALHPGGQNSDDMIPTGKYLIVPDWDMGTTEGGSSGAPLFDKNKRIVGQLYGGWAACGNNFFDSFGWFHYSWEGDGTAGTRLKDWLDPDDFGITTIEGKWNEKCLLSVEVLETNIEECNPDSIEYHLVASESFQSDVTLSINELPEGVNAVFSENPVLPGDTLRLVISNTNVLSEGSYTLHLSASDSLDVSESNLTFTIFESIPDKVILVFPENEAEDIPIIAGLYWLAETTDTQYDIEISFEPDFSTPITTSNGIMDTLFAGDLLPDTSYYWRVRAENSCGMGAWSDVFSFSTASLQCGTFSATDTPISISPDNTSSYTSTIPIYTSGVVIDVNVRNLQGEHSWIGDLTFILTSPSGTSVTLLSELCEDMENFNISFDDEVASSAIPCPYTNGGVYQAVGSLSNFIGEDAFGEWTLTVEDNFDLDGGILNTWSLELCVTPQKGVSLAAVPDSLAGCKNQIFQFNLTIGEGFDTSGVFLNMEGFQNASVEFDANPAFPGDTVTATVVNLELENTGSYTLLITASDTINSFSAVTPFALDIYGPPALFGLSHPANNATDIPLNTNLEWGEAEGAEYYELKLFADTGLTQILLDTIIQNNSSPLNDLEWGSTYYWSVEANNECGSTEYIIPYYFTTVYDYSLELTPMELEVCASENAHYSITLGQNFDSLSLEINIEGLPEGAEITYSAIGSEVDITISKLISIPEGSYTMTIIVQDAVQQSSTVAVMNILPLPKAPQLLTPENGTLISDESPIISWSTSSEINSYLLEIAMDESFAAPIETVSLTDTTYAMDNLIENGIYYWRVTVENECGAATSETYSFDLHTNSVKEWNGKKITLLPNPAGQWFVLELSEPMPNDFQATLFSIDGRLLKKRMISRYETNILFDVSNYTSGVYILRLQDENSALNYRLAVQQ